MNELGIEKLGKMSTSDLSVIRSQIKTGDISNIRSIFPRTLVIGYLMIIALRDYTFYTMLDRLDKILVSIKAMKVGLSFPLDLFVVDYLQTLSLTLIQLTPNY